MPNLPMIELATPRDATCDDVERALTDAYVELPIAGTEAELELFNRMLDLLVVPRGENE